MARLFIGQVHQPDIVTGIQLVKGFFIAVLPGPEQGCIGIFRV
jgi:hypothetical protein